MGTGGEALRHGQTASLGGDRIPICEAWDNRKNRWLTTLALVLLLGGVAWHASLDTPAGPAERGALGWHRARLRAVIAVCLVLAGPVALVGDLNSGAKDRQIRRPPDTPVVHDPVGQILGRLAPRRVDWLVTRRFRCLDAGIRDNRASNPLMIWAELELLPGSR
jgi:hypothetical protein